MTDPTKTPAEITKALMQPFPADVIDEKQGLLYVPAEIVRLRLIEATDNQFDWHLDRTEFRLDGASTRTERSSQERVEVPVAVAYGHLTIPGLGTRAGVGVQEIQPSGGADSAYKGAESDALKRAAMQFGVGLTQLYIETGAAKREKKQPSRPQQNRQPRPQPPQTQSTATEAHATPAPRLLPVAEFRDAFIGASTAKDGRRLNELMDDASDSLPHWIAMLETTSHTRATEWIKEQMERRNVPGGSEWDAAYTRQLAAVAAKEPTQQ